MVLRETIGITSLVWSFRVAFSGHSVCYANFVLFYERISNFTVAIIYSDTSSGVSYIDSC